MNQTWSWILTVWGVVGLAVAGRKRAVGWLISLSAQPVWLTYSIVTRQWGFILSAVAYGAVQARNWLAWRDGERTSTSVDDPSA